MKWWCWRAASPQQKPAGEWPGLEASRAGLVQPDTPLRGLCQPGNGVVSDNSNSGADVGRYVKGRCTATTAPPHAVPPAAAAAAAKPELPAAAASGWLCQ